MRYLSGNPTNLMFIRIEDTIINLETIACIEIKKDGALDPNPSITITHAGGAVFNYEREVAAKLEEYFLDHPFRVDIGCRHL